MIGLIRSIGLGLYGSSDIIRGVYVTPIARALPQGRFEVDGLPSMIKLLIRGRYDTVGDTQRDLQTAVEWSRVEGASAVDLG